VDAGAAPREGQGLAVKIGARERDLIEFLQGAGP
jgi:hypothetical protein